MLCSWLSLMSLYSGTAESVYSCFFWTSNERVYLSWRKSSAAQKVIFLKNAKKKIRNTPSDAKSPHVLFSSPVCWLYLDQNLCCDHQHLRKPDQSNRSRRFLFVSSELLFLIIILPLVLPQNQRQTTVLCCVVKIKWKRVIKRDFY